MRNKKRFKRRKYFKNQEFKRRNSFIQNSDKNNDKKKIILRHPLLVFEKKRIVRKRNFLYGYYIYILSYFL